MLSCEELLILRKLPTGEFKGYLQQQEIIFPVLVTKYPHMSAPYMVNAVSIEDEFMRIVQNTFLLSVYNYLAIPWKPPNVRNNPVTEIMIFMNKQSKRRGHANFSKVDEVLGQIASQFNAFLARYDKLYGMYEREKELKTFTYRGAGELLSCVMLFFPPPTATFWQKEAKNKSSTRWEN